MWSLLLVALLLYLFTLDNGLQPEELRGGDLITHQYAQVQARPGNAPGYPVYTMGGWLWFHGLRWILQTVGGLAGQTGLVNPIPILSSYSLLWALCSLWFFYQIIVHIQKRWLLGFAHSAGQPTEADVTPYLQEDEASLIQLKRTTAASGLQSSQTKPSMGLDRSEPGASLPQLFVPWLLSAFYAVTYFFWFYATTTEQYSSAIAQTLAIVYLYLKFRDVGDANDEIAAANGGNDISRNQSTERQPTTHSPPLITLFLMAFLSGLSLAHMLTVAFIVPPLIAVILWQYPTLLRNVRAIVGSILVAVLPLVSYLYIYMRGGSHPEWWGEGDWATPNQWFWSFVSTAQGRDELARGFEAWCGPFAGGFPAGMWHELSLPILLLGLLGISLLGRRVALLFYGTLAIYLIFSWMYRCGNWFQVILPVYPLILIGLLPLLQRYWQWTDKGAKGFASVSLQWLPNLLLLVAIVWRFDASWPQVNSRNRAADSALIDVAHLIDESIPLGSALFATLDNALALQYLNQIWGLRPDLEIVDHKEARRRVDNGQFVIATYESTPQLLSEMREGTVMGLWGVTPDWVALQDSAFIDEDSYGDPDVMLNHSIEDGVELVGYSIRPGPAAQLGLASISPAVDLVLYWQLSDGLWPDGLSISVRPTRGGAFIPLTAVEPGAAPDAIVQQDQSRPLQGLEPISHIPMGQHFGDMYRLPLPSPEAADGVLLILYRAEGEAFQNVAEIRLERY